MSCKGPTKLTRERMTKVLTILDRHLVINAASIQRLLNVSRDSATHLLYTMQSLGLIQSADLVQGAYTRPGLTVTRQLSDLGNTQEDSRNDRKQTHNQGR